MQMKERMQLPRTPMPEQDPHVRARNFDEVPLGYTPQQAQIEALRCIQCKNPACMDGCPVSIDIPGFIGLIAEGDFVGAARRIKETNALPAVCGRVCPQEEQCESLCVRGKKSEPVAIGRLERFAADYERSEGEVSIPAMADASGRRVAIVGSGPAGLAVAGDLIKQGHAVVVFEALHQAGGVLVYGIPEFRLPKLIVEAEVDYLKKMGVHFETSHVVGKLMTVDELLNEEGFDAVFIGTGAGLPVFMNIAGENLNGIYSANEFLTRANLMKAYKFPQYDTPIVNGKSVAVIGGGNVAMDSARTAMRLGADNVYLIYRRSKEEMPARNEEIHHAEEEGIKFQMLTGPIAYNGTDSGWVTSIVCEKMELGEPDESGRRRPVVVPDSRFEIEVDTVVVAIGSSSNPLVQSTTPGLEVNRWNNIMADDGGRTSRDGVFAGGDIVTGAATVIQAMGAGRQAAAAMHEYLLKI